MVAATTLGVVAAGVTMAAAEVTTPNTASLASVGPASGVHGFPVWYEDGKALRLEQCLDIEDPLCDPAFLLGEGMDPARPVGVGATPSDSNFPGESFYYQALNSYDLPGGGQVDFVSALEATFANEEARDGDQVVFGRIRIRIDGLQAGGTYTVTHPYGVDTFQADAEGEIRFVEDKTPAPGNFGLALRSRVAPFLVRDVGGNGTPDLITNALGTYIGDPAGETTVTGSAFGTNYVEVSGPGLQNGAGRDTTFAVLGKVSTNSGVDGVAAYRIDNPGTAQDYVDVYARAGENDSVQVTGPGVPMTTLDGSGNDYFARIPVTAFPTEVTVTNASDKPVASKKVPVTANVAVTGATYDKGTLTVRAQSSDSGATLTANVGGAPLTFTDGVATATVAAPPATVTVTSSGGGSDTAPVLVLDATAGQVVPQAGIIAGLPTAAGPDATIPLNASSSTNVTSFAWSASAGTITPATGPTATFTAPSAPGDVTITLTTQGSEGTKTTSAVVSVLSAAELTTVTATSSAASPAPGSSVTLTATGTNVSSYRWEQTAGPAVTVANLNAATVTFTTPTQPVTFRVTATGPRSTATASVTVTPGELLAVTAGENRTRDREWRVSGTSSDTTQNSVQVFLATTVGTRGPLVGSTTVDALGAWTLRVPSNGVVPTSTQIRLVAVSSNGTESRLFTYTSRR